MDVVRAEWVGIWRRIEPALLAVIAALLLSSLTDNGRTDDRLGGLSGSERQLNRLR